MLIGPITYGVTLRLTAKNVPAMSMSEYTLYLHILGIQPDGWKTATSDN